MTTLVQVNVRLNTLIRFLGLTVLLKENKELV